MHLTDEAAGLGQPGRSGTHAIKPNATEPLMDMECGVLVYRGAEGKEAPSQSHTCPHPPLPAPRICTDPAGLGTPPRPLTHVVLLLYFPYDLGVG